MSIVACVKVYDGIVLGAESMSQLIGQPAPGQSQFIKAYSNAKKLFQIKAGPYGCGVLAYGIGNIGPRSVQSLLYEFSEQSGALTANLIGPVENMTVEDVASRLSRFIRTSYDNAFQSLKPEQKPVMGFYVAGYSPNQHFGSEWEFVLPRDQAARRSRPDAEFGAAWRGVSGPFFRLSFGFDPRIVDALVAQGMPADITQKIQATAKTFAMPVVFDGMPLQDAIGYCKFILETTINASTYEVGVPTCGGPLHIAVITRGDGFCWIAKPEYTQ